MKKQALWMLLTVFTLMVLVVAGCSNNDEANSEGEDSNSQDTTDSESAEEGSGGSSTFVFGRGADSEQLDPSKVTDGESI